MTITASKTDFPSNQFIRVGMGQNDEFVLDFSGSRDFGKSDPNGQTGIRVRAEADTGIGVTTAIALGKQKSVETLRIGYTATATEFYLDRPIPSDFFVAGRRVYCRNETENQVRAAAYDEATRKVTITEAFGRNVLPTDTISMDLNEVLQNQPKIEAGSTASILRFNAAGDQYIHPGYDIEIQIGTNRHCRRISSTAYTHVVRSGSPNFNLSALDTGSDIVTFTAANYRQVESAGTMYVAATGGYTGWAVGDIVEFRGSGGSRGSFYSESGTRLNFGGSGSPSNVQLRFVDPVKAWTLDRALPSVPANDTDVYIVSGQNSPTAHPLVEVSSPSTTTQPLLRIGDMGFGDQRIGRCDLQWPAPRHQRGEQFGSQDHPCRRPAIRAAPRGRDRDRAQHG